ncbi:hypothetical protein OOT55_16900 [Marinimicrobium sp. C6131]|uniref:hypothetical protein n=1 Tax=Marinimicrobium sp. C6131 TaxID=3022676 RepID=UPI00223D6FF7|nr:hypothetical protein [Marinimicrobium sp. C6131]UZJ44319.1 hypothetical protein OOT55_16900 [Marinimicrobium sp. C6131]
MNDADFQLIMAYSDGETGPEDTARAQALLADSAEARAALANMRTMDDRLRASLDEVLHEPVPERLTRAATVKAPVRGRLLRFPGRLGVAPSHWAMAASVVVVLSAVLFWATSPEPDAEAMQRFVYQTLEQTPSGERRTDADRGWQVMPLASYETADGRLCREYAGRMGTDTLSGLACRADNDQWQTLVSETHAVPEGYRPAAGPTDTMAAVLAGLQAGEPLTEAEEAARLRRVGQ